jgi:hypothetical protein
MLCLVSGVWLKLRDEPQNLLEHLPWDGVSQSSEITACKTAFNINRLAFYVSEIAESFSARQARSTEKNRQAEEG